MSKILTGTEIRKVYGANRDWHAVSIFLLNQQEEDSYLILHIAEEDVGKSLLPVVVMQYCSEVWIIRQIGPATCIKHRYRPTPFDCMFF